MRTTPFLALLALSCAVPSFARSALSLTITSGDGTEVRDGERWVPAPAAWRHPVWPDVGGATWIWRTPTVSAAEAEEGTDVVTFRERFDAPAACSAVRGTLRISADNSFRARLNGAEVGASGVLAAAKEMPGASCCEVRELEVRLQPGENVLEVDAASYAFATRDPKVNPAGIAWRLDVSCVTKPEKSGAGR